jgi:mRNA-degrading endonuclease RelE of RelBE toxin-antitoxin system
MPRYTRRAEKDLAALPLALRSRAESIAGQLDRDPALGKKLLGKLAGKRSVRVGRSYRMLYAVGEEGVTVLTIAQRKDVYG